MLFRLKVYRLALKIMVYILPFAAFEIGWRLWAFSMMLVGRPLRTLTVGIFLSWYSVLLCGRSWRNATACHQR